MKENLQNFLEKHKGIKSILQKNQKNAIFEDEDVIADAKEFISAIKKYNSCDDDCCNNFFDKRDALLLKLQEQGYLTKNLLKSLAEDSDFKDDPYFIYHFFHELDPSTEVTDKDLLILASIYAAFLFTLMKEEINTYVFTSKFKDTLRENDKSTLETISKSKDALFEILKKFTTNNYGEKTTFLIVKQDLLFARDALNEVIGEKSIDAIATNSNLDSKLEPQPKPEVNKEKGIIRKLYEAIINFFSNTIPNTFHNTLSCIGNFLERMREKYFGSTLSDPTVDAMGADHTEPHIE